MVDIHNIKNSIDKIIAGFKVAYNVEIAVFDYNCNIVTCTTEYRKQKGIMVHKLPLEEVFSHDKVLVSQPGKMESCKGCRFKDNCPSTIEILNSIKLNDFVIGAISITTFTKEGHNRITKNTKIYSDLLQEVSSFILNMIMEGPEKPHFLFLNKMLDASLESSFYPIIAINKDGLATHFNSLALKLLSFCNLSTKSVKQIIPSSILEDILKGRKLETADVNNEHFKGKLSSTPIYNDDNFLGALITLKYNRPDPNISDNSANNFTNQIIGHSNQVTSLKKSLEQFANSTSPVLITGDTGTGKELFAKAIHNNSDRKNSPFITINCAGIPETLFESELFGYAEGAFTGAKKGGKQGKFELAQGGTILLDEIGEIPYQMQAKLLRVLQEYSIERVGGTYPISLDVRIISATNNNLDDLVAENKFRADLYYRLNIIPVYISSLQDRKEDIEELCEHFIKKHNRALNKNIKGIHEEVLNIFKLYNWPGNIRELENTIEYSINMCNDYYIQTTHLPNRITIKAPDDSNISPLKDKVKVKELNSIQSLLNKHGWDIKGKKQVAKELGISIRTLYRKLNR